MNIKRALPLLALSLAACASKPTLPQAIPAVPQQRVCPTLSPPPAALIVPPRKTDFLSPTGSSPQSKPSSSTNSSNG